MACFMSGLRGCGPRLSTEALLTTFCLRPQPISIWCCYSFGSWLVFLSPLHKGERGLRDTSRQRMQQRLSPRGENEGTA